MSRYRNELDDADDKLVGDIRNYVPKYLSGKKEEKKMSSHHDKLNIMTTEEILKKNVYDLQEQLVVANKRVRAFMDKVIDLNEKISEINQYISGIEICLSDVKRLHDD